MPGAGVCLKFCLIGYCKKSLARGGGQESRSIRLGVIELYATYHRIVQGNDIKNHRRSDCSVSSSLRPTSLLGTFTGGFGDRRKTLVAHRTTKCSKRLPQIVTVGLVVYIVTLNGQCYPILPDVQLDEVSLVLLCFEFPAGGGMLPFTVAL